MTGASIMATQLGGKRLEILTELVPAPTPYSRTRRSNLDGAASPRCSPKRRRMARGRAAIYPVHRPRRSRQLSTERRSPTPRHSTCRRRPSSTAIVNHIGPERPAATPAIYQWPETAEEGGFAAYGPRFTKVNRQLARQVVKVLRGARPADIPVEQPTEFELVINLKTAQALGLTVPPSILARADEVIE